ncbi:hypothetical protein [Rossellomorea sp. NPDC077527]|uniref:hypothetical protein n=1 Tax=Rossellomorea sp. NPDC077527 TaxID=3364510 RepID=UPI0037C7C500
MKGTINPIRLREVIEYEDLFHDTFSGSCLRTGRIVQIVYWIKPGKSFISYDILDGKKKYLNIDDCPAPPSVQRCEIGFQTAFDLDQSVDIEIAGVKRTSVIEAINIHWDVKGLVVLYGVRDRTDTTYYGIQEDRLKEWNVGHEVNGQDGD